MRAAKFRKNDGGLEEGNVFTTNDLRMLKTKGIYGLNASGKSNIVRAMGLFQNMVLKSVNDENITSMIWDERFALITDWDDEPVFFQLVFLENDIIYRYGFQVKENIVNEEWLFMLTGNSEVKLFTRGADGVAVNSTYFEGGEDYVKLTKTGNHEVFRPDTLFLTGAALMGNKQAKEIRDAIRNIIFIDGMDDTLSFFISMKNIENVTDKEKSILIELLKEAETGIIDLKIVDATDNLYLKTSESKILQGANKKNENKNVKMLISFKNRYDEEGNLIEQVGRPFFLWESEGTKKWFGLSSLILDTLKTGKTLIIDEFDTRFHPNLTLKIVDLFHSPNTNPHNAQLIFVSHDTGLLRRAKLRRDQICLVDKDKYGISSLRTLIEYKGVRKDASYDKEYLQGSYGAVAYLNEIDNIISEYLNETDELPKAE